MQDFINEYWPYILACAPLLAKILNRITPHWSRYQTTIMQVIGLVIELLDVLRKPTTYKASIKRKK